MSVNCRIIFNWLFNVKLRTFLFFVGGVVLFYLFVIVLQQVAKEFIPFTPLEEIKDPVKWSGNFAEVTNPVVLWWTPFTGNSGETRMCGDVACFFTDDRRFANHSYTKYQTSYEQELLEELAMNMMFTNPMISMNDHTMPVGLPTFPMTMVFYGSLFDPLDLPLPRDGSRLDWALLHEESPKNTPILMHADTLSLFNFSATFSRESSFPLTLQYLPSIEALTGSEFLTPISTKRLQAPVLFVHSDCGTPLDRDSYAAELMKHIRVDSLGKCLQNKPLPPHLSDMTSMDAEDFLHLAAGYLFTLSFENARCEDYVTEKLWRPLIVGSVPVYLGSPSVRDWLPNNDSAILASEFSSPAALAKHLLQLSEDRARYERHLRHKLAPPAERVTNRRLIEAVKQRAWGMGDDVYKGNFVEHYECFLCRKIHDRPQGFRSVVPQEHYRCENPVSSLTGKSDPANWWLDQWASSACEAKVLRSHVEEGRPLETQQQLQESVDTMRDAGLC